MLFWRGVRLRRLGERENKKTKESFIWFTKSETLRFIYERQNEKVNDLVFSSSFS